MSHTKLVITAAVRDELPISFIKECGCPVVTTKALRSGICGSFRKGREGIVFVITGVGKEKSRQAAEAICEHLSPLAVVNVGTCGLNSPTYSFGHNGPGVFVASETKTPEGVLRCHLPLPFPLPEDVKPQKAWIESLERPLLKHSPCIGPLVDMEAGFQNQIFSRKNISFSCLKVASDTCSDSTRRDYKNSLQRVRSLLQGILGFIDTKDLSPSISVIIPVRNRYRRLERCIRSVLAQTYKPKEVIVIDDASRPPIASMLPGDVVDKITLIRLQEKRGVSFARNQGIRKATGDWIALLDSDDEWTPGKLSNQVAYLQANPFFEILQCEEIWIRNGKRVNRCKHHEKEEGWIFEKSLGLCAISPSAVLLRKDLLDTYGPFDERFPACEDYELWLRITRQKPVGLNPEPDLIRYGGHSDQLSARYPAMDRFRVAALLKALENEDNPELIKSITAALKQRLLILYTGAQKRQKLHDASIYQEILGHLEAKRHVSWTNYPILLKKYP